MQCMSLLEAYRSGEPQERDEAHPTSVVGEAAHSSYNQGVDNRGSPSREDETVAANPQQAATPGLSNMSRYLLSRSSMPDYLTPAGGVGKLPEDDGCRHDQASGQETPPDSDISLIPTPISPISFQNCSPSPQPAASPFSGRSHRLHKPRVYSPHHSAVQAKRTLNFDFMDDMRLSTFRGRPITSCSLTLSLVAIFSPFMNPRMSFLSHIRCLIFRAASKSRFPRFLSSSRGVPKGGQPIFFSHGHHGSERELCVLL